MNKLIKKVDQNIDQLFVKIKTDHSESPEDYQNSCKVGRNQSISENTQLVFESQIGKTRRKQRFLETFGKFTGKNSRPCRMVTRHMPVVSGDFDCITQEANYLNHLDNKLEGN